LKASYKKPSLSELAASFGFGLARNHPFMDGNKRVALAAIGVFLDLNGYELAAEEADVAVTMLGVAAEEIGERRLAVWTEANLRPRTKSSEPLGRHRM
jgi:death-on-curing protein